MKITFRTDASLQIGTGHVMRCLTLADALQEAGAQCHFICREHPGNLIELIRQRGFGVSVLPLTVESVVTPEQRVETQPNYASWLGVDWNIDAEQTKVGVGETAVDWLVVDHYALDVRWEQMLRPVCRNLMVIDDLANRAHDCDLLLDQNLGRDERDYGQFVPKSCSLLVGPQYALLRPEFAALRDESLRRRAIPQFKHLLISMGGVDQVDATGKVLEALLDCHLPEDLYITVVMGPHAPWLARVQMLAKRLPQPVVVKVNINNMAQVMAASDLAIGAAGSTSWERCCLGLPAFLVVLAENQMEAAANLELAGAINRLYLDKDFGNQIQNKLQHLINQNGQLRQMSISASKITLGKGADQIRSYMSIN